MTVNASPEPELTRRSLHAVAEVLMAGPQFEQSKTIKLQVSEGGFATVKAPDVRLVGVSLAVAGREVALNGRTITDVAAEAGLLTRRLDDVYSDVTPVTDTDFLQVDPDAAAVIADAFRRGDEALRSFAPHQRPVLWPEHFDLGISVGEVNFGVSPGDGYLAVPYAYVGPWSPSDFTGTFWNAPFGSARPLTEVADLLAYFEEGQALTSPVSE